MAKVRQNALKVAKQNNNYILINFVDEYCCGWPINTRGNGHRTCTTDR